MEENFGSSSEDHNNSQPTFLPVIMIFIEYFLITIPPVGILILQGYINKYGKGALPSDWTLFIILVVLPILICLFIMTLQYRKYDARTALLHYKKVGLYIPLIFVCCLIIATFSGWIEDNGVIGWLIIMAIPAAYIFSFITASIGKVLRFIIIRLAQS